MGAGLNIGIAFAAGLLSFLSPCVLPLIPAYLSLMGGTSLQEMQKSGKLRKNAVVNTLFFVLGFSIVFMALGILFTSTFALLGGASQIINIIAGSIVVVLGLNFIFDFWKILNIERRFHMSGRPTNKPMSLFFGMAFGAGWTPCIGPILSSILFLAGSSGELVRGTVLLSVYSLGLGVPFVLAGTFLPAALRQLDRIKPHLTKIKIGSGIFLVLVGALIGFGQLERLNIFLFSIAYQIEAWEEANPAGSRIAFGIGFIALALLIALFYIRRIYIESKKIRETPDSISASNGDHSVAGSDYAEATDTVKTGTRTGSGKTRVEQKGLVRPFRLTFIALFTAAAILSFTGILNFSQLLSFWFSYQGI